jgi:MFS family permease
LPLDRLSKDLSSLQQQRNAYLVRWRIFALLSDLADCYEAHERSLYFGYYTGLSMFAITIGPLLPVYIPPLAVWDTNFQFAFWLG